MSSNQNFYEELRRLVAFPSISSDPAYAGSVRDCALYLKKRLERLPAEVKLIKTNGHPLIVARIKRNPSWPTVAIYNHYDVQPIAEPDKWKSAPFVLKSEKGRYYGRGAADDKGNLLAALLAVELALARGLALNFEFIYEGEEESGSPNFKAGIARARGFLNPDSIIIADGGWVSKAQPTLIYGIRGLLYMHWNMKTGKKASHSGETGGAARNPLEELMSAAVKCHDAKTGKILIPGVYKKVKRPSKDELQSWDRIALGVDEFMKMHELKTLRVKNKSALLKTIWARPTFEVHGCVGGYMKKDGRMTLVPSEGQLLVSMRLVPEQKPEEILKQVRSYVAKLNPDIKISVTSQSQPYVGHLQSAEVNAATQALEKTFRLPVIKARIGGSIGAVADLHATFENARMFVMSFSLPEYGIHGPNEYFEHRMAMGGIKAFYDYFEIISKAEAARR